MRIGALREKIIIQNTTEAQNTYGEPVTTWEDYAFNRWANVEPLAGREYFNGQQQVARIDTKFTLRYLRGIKPKMRVLYNSETYDIESVINVGERNRELQLMCIRITT